MKMKLNKMNSFLHIVVNPQSTMLSYVQTEESREPKRQKQIQITRVCQSVRVRREDVATNVKGKENSSHIEMIIIQSKCKIKWISLLDLDNHQFRCVCVCVPACMCAHILISQRVNLKRLLLTCTTYFVAQSARRSVHYMKFAHHTCAS